MLDKYNFTKAIIGVFLLFISSNLNGQIEYEDYTWEDEPNFETPKIVGDISEVIVKDKTVLEYYFDGNGFYQFDLRHKVTYIASEAGVEENNKIYLSSAGDDQIVYQIARVINSKGELIEFDEKDIQEGENEESGYTYKYFALEGLDIGSFVEVLFLQKRTDMYNGDREYFQSRVPTYNIDFELICPEGLIFSFHSINGLAEVQFDTLKDEKNYWSLSIDSLPAFEVEELAFVNSNLQSLVYKLSENEFNGASDLASYGSASKNYYSFVYKSPSKKDIKALKKFLKEIGINEQMDDEQKIRKFESYVKENFAILPYVQPAFAQIKPLIKNKASNAATFTQFYANAFKLMDIKHRLVLTTDRSNIRFDKDFEAYNFLQSTVFYFPSLDKYLQPNSANYRLGFIDQELMHNYGLFIKEVEIGDITSAIGQVKFIDALSHSESANNHFVKADLSVDPLEPEIQFELHMSGYYASYLQTAYSQISDDEKTRLEESLVEMVTMEKNDQAELEVINGSAEDFGLKPMIVKSTVNSIRFSEKAGEKIIFKIGELIGPQSEMYSEKERIHAVESDFNREFIRKLEITLPENYDVSNLEGLNFDVVFPDESAWFKSNYKLEGNLLIVEVEEYYKRIEYSKEEFEDYKKVINAAADFNKAVIYLTEKS